MSLSVLIDDVHKLIEGDEFLAISNKNIARILQSAFRIWKRALQKPTHDSATASLPWRRGELRQHSETFLFSNHDFLAICIGMSFK